MKTLYCHVIDDSGFSFGMDTTTPVCWEFSSRPRKHVYTSFAIPNPSPRQQDYAAQEPQRVLSLRDLRAFMAQLA